VIPEALLRRLRGADRIVISSHANPDGDAIGSELGLARVLAGLGKAVSIWNLDPTPPVYAPMPGSGRIHAGAEPPAGFPGRFDLAFVLECPTLDRTGLEAQLAALPLVNVDHHLGNQRYGAENWVDTEAPAVGVMVADLARALEVPLDADAASCLLLALVTDTGGFRFANATPAAFEAAARLVREGARVERVAQWVYESQPEGAVRLLGELLATLERHDGGRIATVHLTPEMFARAGASPGDSEGLIDTPRSIAGVEAVALFRRIGDGEWKVSLRSRGEVDVQRVALAEGGGGHKNAAGCRFRGALAEAEARFLAHLRRALEESGAREDHGR
jgi:phosphoesterase RecJ-like protein